MDGAAENDDLRPAPGCTRSAAGSERARPAARLVRQNAVAPYRRPAHRPPIRPAWLPPFNLMQCHEYDAYSTRQISGGYVPLHVAAAYGDVADYTLAWAAWQRYAASDAGWAEHAAASASTALANHQPDTLRLALHQYGTAVGGCPDHRDETAARIVAAAIRSQNSELLQIVLDHRLPMWDAHRWLSLALPSAEIQALCHAAPQVDRVHGTVLMAKALLAADVAAVQSLCDTHPDAVHWAAVLQKLLQPLPHLDAIAVELGKRSHPEPAGAPTLPPSPDNLSPCEFLDSP